ncbi:hypothetical protein vBEcoMphAPEC6_gp195c [Escherichia phage vB_EcoM_phAPEC6]|nr:hypothetical protein vBEcoMphAPEC6_gp195c [Escherichia phage vB_EcoM_phAPEC6]
MEKVYIIKYQKGMYLYLKNKNQNKYLYLDKDLLLK